MNVNCDKCKQDFPIKLKEKRHPKTVIETYFNCPHCNEKYISFVTNEAIRREQKALKEMNEKYLKRKNALQIKMNKLKAEVASR